MNIGDPCQQDEERPMDRSWRCPVTIDPSVFQAVLDQAVASQKVAQAQFDELQTQIAVAEANYEKSVADGKAAKQRVATAEDRFSRATELPREAWTEEDLDQAQDAVTSAKQTLADMGEAFKVAKAEQADTQAKLNGATAQITLAKTRVPRDQLDVTDAVIKAPIAGRVTHRNVEHGAFVSPGTPLMLSVQQQAAMLAYLDVFYIAAILSLCLIPLTLLINKTTVGEMLHVGH